MSPNEAEASSLMRQAQEWLADLRKLPLSEKSASFRLESAYEAIREAMQAFFAQYGFKSYSHEAVIAYSLGHAHISEGEAAEADRYRELRHDINYRARKVNAGEARQAIRFASRLVRRLACALRASQRIQPSR